MVDRKQLILELSKVVGDAYAVHEPEDILVFEYDGSVDKALPLAVVLPASTKEVSEVVASASLSSPEARAPGSAAGPSPRRAE